MEKPIEYYELQKVIIEPAEPGEFRLVTAALITCGLCGGMIDGMGGPGCGAVCLRCAEVVINGGARGAIVWSQEIPSTDDREDGRTHSGGSLNQP